MRPFLANSWKTNREWKTFYRHSGRFHYLTPLQWNALIQRVLALMQVHWSRILGRQILTHLLFCARLFWLEVNRCQLQLPYFSFLPCIFLSFQNISRLSQDWLSSCLAVWKLRKSLNSWMNNFHKVEKLIMRPFLSLIQGFYSEIDATFSTLEGWSKSIFIHGSSHSNNGWDSLSLCDRIKSITLCLASSKSFQDVFLPHLSNSF